MKVGTYYYPEHWPRSEWERDFDLMAKMGLKIVHMSEFAWGVMEPEAGRFEFEWLDHCIQLAAEREMDVILCTPTAAPPAWLTHTHRDILMVNASGEATEHGGRRHYNPLSPAYHDATRRIVGAMAEHFGDRREVIGWQIDNELCSGVTGGGFDQSETTHAAFRQWLRDKYDGDIARLNDAWGTEFWSTQYGDFEQIRIPPQRRDYMSNPHQSLDASRFWSRAWADFTKLQADILKNHIGDRWITTNFMPFAPDADPGDFGDSLSLWSWDSYPAPAFSGPYEGEDFRLGDPRQLDFMHEQMASYNGRWALFELQPGQINWSGFPVLIYPGATRLWLWQALSRGAEFCTTYRFRQPRVGNELHHHGLVEQDGTTLSPGGRAFAQVAEEIVDLQEATGKFAEFETLSRDEDAPVTLLYDVDELWLYKAQPQAEQWDYPKLVMQWHGAFARLGLEASITTCRGDDPVEIPEGTKIVVAPGLQMMSVATLQALRAFVEAGGVLVITCRVAHKDRHGRAHPTRMGEGLFDLLGGSIEAYDALPKGHVGHVSFDGSTEKHAWHIWGDLLQTQNNGRTLAEYADQFYEGATAVTTNVVGKGMVIYCGVFDDGGVTRGVAEVAARQSKLDTVDLPDRVRLVRRQGVNICMNHSLVPFRLEMIVPPKTRFLVGGKTVPPAGVSIWLDA